jgi:hypothetical protein
MRRDWLMYPLLVPPTLTLPLKGGGKCIRYTILSPLEGEGQGGGYILGGAS